MNLATYTYNASYARDTEVPNADWQGGATLGGRPYVGAATGQYRPSYETGDSDTYSTNQAIGLPAIPVGVDTNDPAIGTGQLACVIPLQATPNGGNMKTIDTHACLNLTGVTVGTSNPTWGVVDMDSAPVVAAKTSKSKSAK